MKGMAVPRVAAAALLVAFCGLVASEGELL